MASSSSRGPGRSSSRGRRPSAPSGGRTTTSRQRTSVRKPPGATPSGSGPQLTTRAVVLLSVVLLLIASYTSTLHAWWESRGEIQTLRAENEMREQSIVDLEDQKDRWDDPAYVRQQARERFGFVMPGEIGYRVIGSDGVVQGDVPTLDAPPAAESTQWYDKLWGSVEQSGRDPEPEPAPDPEAPSTDDVLGDE